MDLSEHLRQRHQRLMAILDDVEALILARSFTTATLRFGEFRLHQERHFREEEELVQVLATLPDQAEVLARLEEGHRGLQAQMSQFQETLSRRRDGFPLQLQRLRQAIVRHETEETTLLLPALQACLGKRADCDQLLRNLADV